MSKKEDKGDAPVKDKNVENCEEDMGDVWWGCCAMEKGETLSDDVGAINVVRTKREAVEISCQFLGSRLVKSVAVFPVKFWHGPIQFITPEDIELVPQEDDGDEDESDDEQPEVDPEDKYGPS